MEPKKIGGVNIYAPIKSQEEVTQDNGTKLYKVVLDNGSNDGITLEYKSQSGKNGVEPTVFYEEKSGYFHLRHLDSATIFGSEINDKIKSSSNNCIFNFKNGGSDILKQANSEGTFANNKINIDSNDRYIASKILDGVYEESVVFSGSDNESSKLNYEYSQIKEL